MSKHEHDSDAHLDASVAVLRERIDNVHRGVQDRLDLMRIQASEFESEVRGFFKTLVETGRQLNLRERERNSNIEKLFERQSRHDEWHGQNDKNIADRLGTIEAERKEASIRKSVLTAQWKLITTLLGAGGAIVTALIYLLEIGI